MTDKHFPPFIAAQNAFLKEQLVLLCITRDSGLQERACQDLEGSLDEVRSEKANAIDQLNEGYANLLLGFECVHLALIAELQMWLHLKWELPDEAWGYLIDAQDYSENALRAHEGFHHLGQNLSRLIQIEKVVFPPQIFVSSGMIVKSEDCSICRQDYDQCDHVMGKPYMGEFCRVVVTEAEFDHVAFVENPSDKRCRAERFSDTGGNRNRMTWAIEAQEEGV